jgi:hypothetical protein
MVAAVPQDDVLIDLQLFLTVGMHVLELRQFLLEEVVLPEEGGVLLLKGFGFCVGDFSVDGGFHDYNYRDTGISCFHGCRGCCCSE